MNQKGHAMAFKYVDATSDEPPNRREMATQFQTDDGSGHTKVFQDAAGGMPIMSAGKMTEDDLDVLLQKTGGKVMCPETGRGFNLIKRSGVYVCKMRIPKHLACPREVEQPSGFTRPGTA